MFMEDVVEMRVDDLPWVFSDSHFKPFFETVPNSILAKVRWKIVDPDEMGWEECHLGHTIIDSYGNAIILLARHLDAARAEFTVAHELTHAVLQHEGFPRIERTDAPFVSSEWIDIASHLKNALDDGIIVARLTAKPFEFDLTPWYEHAIERHLKGLQQLREASDPIRKWSTWCDNCIIIMEACLELPPSEWEKLQPAFKSFSPLLTDSAEFMIRLVNHYGLETPRQYGCSAMAIIRAFEMPLSLGTDTQLLRDVLQFLTSDPFQGSHHQEIS